MKNKLIFMAFSLVSSLQIIADNATKQKTAIPTDQTIIKIDEAKQVKKLDDPKNDVILKPVAAKATQKKSTATPKKNTLTPQASSVNTNKINTDTPATKTTIPTSALTDKKITPQKTVLHTIDSIKVKVCINTDIKDSKDIKDGKAIICESDIKKPGLSGAMRSIDDIVFEQAVYFDAKKHKVLPDDDAVDKYLAGIQKENNLTMDELLDVFSSAGYTLQEGREQFKVMQAVNTMLDFKIRSNLIVPRSQIEQYHIANPEIIEASYQLQHSIAPYTNNKTNQRSHINSMIANDSYTQWSKPFWINKSDIAAEKHFICDLSIGQVCVPQEISTGFELYKLVDHKPEHPRPLDDKRRLDIMDILRRPRYFKLLEEYKASLYESASIIYL